MEGSEDPIVPPRDKVQPSQEGTGGCWMQTGQDLSSRAGERKGSRRTLTTCPLSRGPSGSLDTQMPSGEDEGPIAHWEDTFSTAGAWNLLVEVPFTAEAQASSEQRPRCHGGLRWACKAFEPWCGDFRGCLSSASALLQDIFTHTLDPRNRVGAASTPGPGTAWVRRLGRVQEPRGCGIYAGSRNCVGAASGRLLLFSLVAVLWGHIPGTPGCWELPRASAPAFC